MLPDFHACLDELNKLATLGRMMKKVADEESITTEQAENALGRLRKLEREKPTAGQLARGAITGAVVSPTASLVGGLVGGTGPKGVFRSARGALGSAVGGAVFGAALPMVRRRLDVEAEKGQLRAYLEKPRRGATAQAAKQVLKE